MNFIITVRIKGQTKSWDEDYNKPGIKTLSEAKQWALETVEFFNKTLRPNESARELVAIREGGNEPTEHQWLKQKPNHTPRSPWGV